MDISQFPERFRARVLATVVRNLRAGIAIRFGKLEGETLPLTIRTVAGSQIELSREALIEHARAAFATLPYTLRIRVATGEGLPSDGGVLRP